MLPSGIVCAKQHVYFSADPFITWCLYTHPRRLFTKQHMRLHRLFTEQNCFTSWTQKYESASRRQSGARVFIIHTRGKVWKKNTYIFIWKMSARLLNKISILQKKSRAHSFTISSLDPHRKSRALISIKYRSAKKNFQIEHHPTHIIIKHLVCVYFHHVRRRGRRGWRRRWRG